MVTFADLRSGKKKNCPEASHVLKSRHYQIYNSPESLGNLRLLLVAFYCIRTYLTVLGNINGILLLFCVNSCRVSVSSCPTARQQSRVVPADAGFLCDEAAVLEDAIKRTLRIICSASLFRHIFPCIIQGHRKKDGRDLKPL